MSADNLIQVLPYIPKDTGVLEYRVYETFLSDDFHVLHLFSTSAYSRGFKTFTDKPAAVAFANNWMRSLHVCEYGVSVGDRHCTWDFLFSEMQEVYKDCEEGPPEDLMALREATTKEMAALPADYPRGDFRDSKAKPVFQHKGKKGTRRK